MNTKVLAVLLVALQCGVLLTQAARTLGEEASHGSLRKVLDSSASQSTGTSAISNDVDGFAAAGVEAFANDGNIFAVATADSEAISKAKSAIAVATTKAIARVRGGGLAAAAADAAAVATAEAIAIAKVTTLVEIVSDGAKNKGCGAAKASAEAEAKAFALAIARAFAKAKNYEAEAIVKEHIGAIKIAYAKAVANSFSAACLKGKGYVKAQQSAFAIAVAKVYVSAFAKALAVVNGSRSFEGGRSGGRVDTDTVTVAGGKDESVIDGQGFAFGGTGSHAFADFFP